jgi:hypothetical protein
MNVEGGKISVFPGVYGTSYKVRKEHEDELSND